MLSYEVDIVISRRTESGDWYLDRYQHETIEEFIDDLKESIDIGYTTEFGVIVINSVNGMDVEYFRSLIDTTVENCYEEEYI